MSRYLNMDDVTDLVNASRSTVSKAIHSGELEAYKVGNRWKIPSDAVDVWVKGDDLDDDLDDWDEDEDEFDELDELEEDQAEDDEFDEDDDELPDELEEDEEEKGY